MTEVCKDCGLLHISSNKMDEVKENIPTAEIADKLSNFFKIFADPTRIKILHALSETELCVLDLSLILEISQSAMSHQLKLLKLNHLVKSRKDGKSVFYSLDDDHIKEVLTQGLSHIKHI